MANIGNDVPATPGGLLGSATIQVHSVSRDVILNLANISRQLANIASTFGASYVSTSGNNTFTGINTFDSGLLYNVRVVTAAGAATVATSDYIVGIDKTVGAATTVNLPAGVKGMYFKIKDQKGDASSHNITITPASGNIDGSGTFVISTNYGSATVYHDGTQWYSIT